MWADVDYSLSGRCVRALIAKPVTVEVMGVMDRRARLTNHTSQSQVF